MLAVDISYQTVDLAKKKPCSLRNFMTSEAYLELSQQSVMELSCENS